MPIFGEYRYWDELTPRMDARFQVRSLEAKCLKMQGIVEYDKK